LNHILKQGNIIDDVILRLVFVFYRSLTSKEFVIPLSSSLKKNNLLRPLNSTEKQQQTSTYIPAMEQFLAVRPKLIKEEE
jgi:hypothetical protein